MRFKGLILVILGLSPPALGIVPLSMEPDYAEAILAFHDKNYREVLRLLSPLVAKAAESEELLELAALAFKSLGMEKKSEAMYTRILDVLKARGAPAKEMAPYEFELGVLHFRSKRWADAAPLFRNSVAQEFNEVPASFFLGVVAMEQKEWGEAEESFSRVSKSLNTDLRLTSHLYLAQVHAATNAQSRMVRDYISARSEAQAELDKRGVPAAEKATAQNVFNQAIKALRPLKSSRFFGNLGLVTSYDTNVFSDASSIVASGGTKKATLKQSVLASLGYATPLLADWQVAATYRGSANKNFAAGTADAQFIQNDVTLAVNHSPLEETAFGLRVTGSALFQYLTASSRYEPYLMQVGAGPYIRRYLGDGWSLGAQGSFLIRNQNTDASLVETFHRSGTEPEVRVSLQKDSRATFFNPGIELTASLRNTKGTEFRSKFVQVDLTNSSYLSPAVQIVTGVAGALTLYGVRPDGPRQDTSLTLRLGTSLRLFSDFYFIGDVQWINNATAVTAYEYQRTVGSAGVTYNF